MDWNDILHRASACRDSLARALGALIRIQSPSRGEGEAIRYIAAVMRELGFDEVRVDAMGNLIGRLGNGTHTLAFDAHVDVVDVIDAPGWRHPPYGGALVGGEVYGRGAADQKGAIASLLCAAGLMRECDLLDNCTVFVVITVQEEECEGLCWCHLIETEGLKPHAVVITEPSACAIARGQKGKVQMLVETSGIASHGSAPELGENAVYTMAPIISGVERLNTGLSAVPPLRKGTVAVTRVESRAPSLCSVPEGCRIYLDRRLTGGETKEDALDQISEIAAPHGGRVRIPRYEAASYRGLTLGREEYYPAWLTAADAPVIRAARRGHRALFGGEGEIIVWDFSTNGVATAGIHGIPTMGYGPGDPSRAHTRDERVPVDQLVTAAAFYAALPSFFAEAAEGR